MAQRPETASQTAGPYVHIGCLPEVAGLEFAGLKGGLKQGHFKQIGTRLRGLSGDPITIKGTLYDGEKAPVLDGMIEIWQPDGSGKFHSNGNGFGRVASDPDTGEFTIETVMPGRVADHNGALQSPHIALWIVARGINLGLHTRVYFENHIFKDDQILTSIPAARQNTLIAKQQTSQNQYKFDIHLQGPQETVFFDV